MGVWGPGPFSNDDAMDMLVECEFVVTKSVLTRLCDEAESEIEADECIDEYTCRSLVAAAAVYAHWLVKSGTLKPAVPLETLVRTPSNQLETFRIWEQSGIEADFANPEEMDDATVRRIGYLVGLIAFDEEKGLAAAEWSSKESKNTWDEQMSGLVDLINGLQVNQSTNP